MDDLPRPQKEIGSSASSVLPESKPGPGTSLTYELPSSSVDVEVNVLATSAVTFSAGDGFASKSTTLTEEASNGVVVPDPIENEHKISDNIGQQDQTQCTDLPEAFEITSDVADAFMVSNSHFSRETHPRPGRNIDRPRNPRVQTSVHYSVGILSRPIQSPDPQRGLQRNNSDSDRWQRGAGFQKGLIPYPQTPLQVMHKQRQLKSILNKLTPQNFEKLFEQVKQVNIDNFVTLSGVISQIFDKALMEPTSCEMYADFCFHLAAGLPNLRVDNETITFKTILLNKCQEEFERGEREEEEANKAEEKGENKRTTEEREEKRLQARRRMLGNIRLIGELYKKKMLTARIMHECINKLLDQYQTPNEENIEALCILMSTIGEMIDHPKAKEHMDAYFDIMANLSNNMKLSSRVRFMLKDVIDLRKNRWQQRRKVEGPKKFVPDAAQERQAQASRLGRAPSMGSSVRRGPPVDFAPRISNMLHPPNSQMSGFRAVPPQTRGYGYQDVRTEERHSLESRTMSVPLSQRPLGDEPITLGPQGGLARGMAFTGQPSAPCIKITDEEEAKQRQFKSILNKLTPQNYEKLFEHVKQVNIDNLVTLSGVISQIFDKALMEPSFCEMYAHFCFHLAAGLPNLRVDNETITFKTLLLDKCQEEFERGEREEEEANKAEEEGENKRTAEEREEKRLQARRRMLGNIRLFGELYKKKMLTARIMHECINKLFGQYQTPDEENIEALCKLMSTIGEMIDHPKAKKHMDAYFDIMANLSNNMKLSSRVRFMLKDVIDLRKNRWQQRMKVEGPKKFDEVHRDAAQERQAQASRLGRASSMGSSVRRGPPSIPLPEMPNPGDSRRTGAGLNGFNSMPHHFGQRGDFTPRYMPDIFAAPPNYDQSLPPDDKVAHGTREIINADHGFDRSLPASPPTRRPPPISMQDVSSEIVWPEEHLRDKSVAAIKEFYSARDENEVALCIKDLNTPSFYPFMISIWVTDSFEKKTWKGIS